MPEAYNVIERAVEYLADRRLPLPPAHALCVAIGELLDRSAQLRELAVWMTGCGYDFQQHAYYRERLHLLGLVPIVRMWERNVAEQLDKAFGARDKIANLHLLAEALTEALNRSRTAHLSCRAEAISKSTRVKELEAELEKLKAAKRPGDKEHSAAMTALGFAHAWCCIALDRGDDPRTIEVPILIADWYELAGNPDQLRGPT